MKYNTHLLKPKIRFIGNKLYQIYYNNAKRVLIKFIEMNLRNIKRQKRLKIHNKYIHY